MKKTLLIIAILSMLLVGCKKTTTTTTTATKTTTTKKATVSPDSTKHYNMFYITLKTQEESPELDDGIYYFTNLFDSMFFTGRDAMAVKIKDNSVCEPGDVKTTLYYQKYHFYNVFGFVNADYFKGKGLYRAPLHNMEDWDSVSNDWIEYLEDGDYYVAPITSGYCIIVIKEDNLYYLRMLTTGIFFCGELDRIEPLTE